MKSKLIAIAFALVAFTGIGGYVYTADPSVQSVIEYSRNGIVIITAQEKDKDGKTTNGGLGTGFFIAENKIITNNHVINGNKPGTVLTVYDQKMNQEYRVKVLFTDESADIAVLELDNWELFMTNNPETTYFNLDTTYRQGDRTIIIGHPTGLMYSASVGVISQSQERIDPKNPKWFIGTDAHVYPGNSGGPMLDAQGDLLGVNDIMIKNEGGSYGFAIPAIILKKIIADFEKYGEVRWATLGISLENNVIKSVTEDGAAKAAGLIVSDQVFAVRIGEETIPIYTVDDLINALAVIDYDTPVTFILNGKEPVTVVPKYRTSKDFEGTK